MQIKKFKPIHWIYNLLHYKSVTHNRNAYRRFNIRKSLFTSVSSKDFPDKESRPWLDQQDSGKVAPRQTGFSLFPPAVQQSIREWSRQGYMILESFFSERECDQINEEIDALVSSRKLRFNGQRKIMFANRKSALIQSVTRQQRLTSILEFLLGKTVVPFQTINFFEGSNQRAHSDSVHMTTYPLGYLIAVWIALEDTNSENGPLFYYPGSHRLPFLLNEDFNQGETLLTLGKKNYHDYEDRIEELIRKNAFQKKEFHAKKGDLLIWHANLVHGGSPILNSRLTRKSMVIHYFANEVIKYHEITERPSLLNHRNKQE